MRLLHVVPNKWLMIDLHQPQWLAAPSSRGYSTIPEGKLIVQGQQTDEKGHRVQEKADEKGHRLQEKADEKGHRPQRQQTS